MPNKIIVDIDETVDPVSIAEMQKSMMEASLMYPGCEFEINRGSMRDSGDIRFGTHVNLYPETTSGGLYNLGGDQTSHIVMTRDELSYGEGLSYRSPSGRTHVVKSDLRALDGLSSDERVGMLTQALCGEAGRMTGRAPSLYFDSDVEAMAAYEEVQKILEDDTADPEETLEELDKVFKRYERKGSGKRRKKKYYAAEQKTESKPVRKSAQPSTQKRSNTHKGSQANASTSKRKKSQTKGGKRRKLKTLEIGEETRLK